MTNINLAQALDLSEMAHKAKQEAVEEAEVQVQGQGREAIKVQVHGRVLMILEEDFD